MAAIGDVDAVVGAPPDPAARIAGYEVCTPRRVACRGEEGRDSPGRAVPPQQRVKSRRAVRHPDLVAGEGERSHHVRGLIRVQPMPAVAVVEPCETFAIADPEPAAGI